MSLGDAIVYASPFALAMYLIKENADSDSRAVTASSATEPLVLDTDGSISLAAVL